jgi:recombination protein RecA
MAPPFTEAEFDITYGEGISKTGDLIDVAVNAGIVDKSGSWYSYDGERIGQGRENAKRFLRDNQDIYDSIYQKSSVALGLVKKEAEEITEKTKKKNSEVGIRKSENRG